MRHAEDLAIEMSAAKVALADQSYEVLDQQIRKLDVQLKLVEDILRKTGADPAVQLRRTLDKERGRGAGGGAGTGGGRCGGSGTALSAARHGGSPSADLPIDPHEPVYCKCRQVASGQMIACDNDLVREGRLRKTGPPFIIPLVIQLCPMLSSIPRHVLCAQCPVEWYHLRCVGLAMDPTGKWYCDECREPASPRHG